MNLILPSHSISIGLNFLNLTAENSFLFYLILTRDTVKIFYDKGTRQWRRAANIHYASMATFL
jgi:hypothetical protein